MNAHHPVFSDPRNRRAIDQVVNPATDPRRWTLFIPAPIDATGRACWMPKSADTHLAAVWRHRLVMERARAHLTDDPQMVRAFILPGASRRPNDAYQPTISLIRGSLPSQEFTWNCEEPIPGQRTGVLIHAWTTS